MSTTTATIKPSISQHWPSIAALAAPLREALIAKASQLQLQVIRTPSGATIIDAGVDCHGSIEAGRLIGELCLGGLGRVSFCPGGDLWPLVVHVHSGLPVLACLGSQYAGLSVESKLEGQKFNALASGPGRATIGREALFKELAYTDHGDQCVLVIESDTLPPEIVIHNLARDARLTPDKLTLVITPTASLAGSVQIAARVLEVALHKAHTLGFPLEAIVDGSGSAPVPPPGKNFIESMGRTNDAILFAGSVQLMVDCDDARAAELAQAMPASVSRDYGRPFADVFTAAKYDFYAIDPMLFAPAKIVVSNLASGRSHVAGTINAELLRESFGVSA